MRGGRVGSLAASPTLVGAVTVLVVVVAVFLAYQANHGLPFVPTYKLSAQLPDADDPGPGNEVRIGGIRVGQITSISPRTSTTRPVRTTRPAVHGPGREGRHGAQPGPRAAARRTRPSSSAPSRRSGLKYLEINRGNSSQGFEPGATMPLTAARPEPVEIDQVFNMFDDPDPDRDPVEPARVRQRARRPRGGPERGDRPAASRWSSSLTPVMRNLADPNTGLGELRLGARRPPRPRSRRSPRSRASSSSTSTRPSAPSPASRGRSSRSRSRARPRPRTPRSPTLPTIRPLPREHRRSSSPS